MSREEKKTTDPQEGMLNVNFTLPKEIKTLHLLTLDENGKRIPLCVIKLRENVDYCESKGLRFFSLRTK